MKMITKEQLKKYVDRNFSVWGINDNSDIVDLLLEYEKDRKDLVNNGVLDDVSINEVEVCPHCGSEAIINFAIAKKCSDCRRMI